MNKEIAQELKDILDNTSAIAGPANANLLRFIGLLASIKVVFQVAELPSEVYSQFATTALRIYFKGTESGPVNVEENIDGTRGTFLNLLSKL